MDLHRLRNQEGSGMRAALFSALLLTGCAGLHPPTGMPTETALKDAEICHLIHEQSPVLSTDLFGASTLLGFGRAFVKEEQHTDCLEFYGFNRD